MFSRTGQALHPNVVVCLVAMVVTLLVTGFTLAVAAPAGQASATPASRAGLGHAPGISAPVVSPAYRSAMRYPHP